MKKVDIIFVLFEFIAALCAVVIVKTIFNGTETIALIVVLLIFVSTILMVVYRRLQKLIIENNQIIKKQVDDDYRQIESLFSVFSTLKITQPLPPMRDWAISPDFAAVLISIICEYKPKTILEASSGVSTLISAYCLKELGCGNILSLDHEKEYADKSKANIKQHGLGHIATVVHAPLKEVEINGKNWLWYDVDVLKKVECVDLFVIDGPPSTLQEMARYPALPLLFKKLSVNAVIVLDDTLRKDEKNIISTWMKEYNCFIDETIITEKGATILHRRTS